MAGKVDQLAIQHRGHLVDPIGHQEATVKDRDLGLMLGQIIAIQVNGAGHGQPQSSGVDGCTPWAS